MAGLCPAARWRCQCGARGCPGAMPPGADRHARPTRCIALCRVRRWRVRSRALVRAGVRAQRTGGTARIVAAGCAHETCACPWRNYPASACGRRSAHRRGTALACARSRESLAGRRCDRLPYRVAFPWRTLRRHDARRVAALRSGRGDAPAPPARSTGLLSPCAGAGSPSWGHCPGGIGAYYPDRSPDFGRRRATSRSLCV